MVNVDPPLWSDVQGGVDVIVPMFGRIETNVISPVRNFWAIVF